jgi:carboxylesterase
MIIPTAEPFFFPGGETGCLLVHGFTGTPKEMRWFGEYLNQKKYSVLGVRLAGHATTPDDMRRSHWEDWVASVEDGLNLLKNCTKKQFIAGLSMGGVLSLLAASYLPVEGCIAISTPFLIPDPRAKYAKYIAFLKPRVEKGEADWHNPEAAKDHVDYPFFPTPAIHQLSLLLEEMRRNLASIKVPVLLVHSKNDKGVLPENAERIFETLTTSEKQLLWVEDSGHVITREPDRYKLFEASNAFIRKFSDKS